jgi:polyhydroxybutyrate depolymerase
MHGLGSNAFEQELYSQFDVIADVQDFIVVYPNAISSNWALFDDSDMNFLDHLIDTVRERYSVNECLFFMGMSQGGFMSYKLACEYTGDIKAIASVTGNMTTFLQATCQGPSGIPLMQFHGTADATVPYNGTFGIPPIENTIDFWVEKNECSPVAQFEELPDTHPEDNCTASSYLYDGGIQESKVVFYKIENGGHSWPGAFPIASLGNTNQDINASVLIGEFFKSYCESPSAVRPKEMENPISIYPNPASTEIILDLPNRKFDISIFDAVGKERIKLTNKGRKVNADISGLEAGLYIIQFSSEEKFLFGQRLVIIK